jgi:hypothetical protein
MEQKTKNISLKAILILIGVGIWAIVLQNAGIIPTNQNVKVVNSVDTYVSGGRIDAKVSGSVGVDNTVNVNLSRINGRGDVFYDFGGNGEYVRIPVMTANPIGY